MVDGAAHTIQIYGVIHVSMQVSEEKATMGQLAKNWVCSYLGNFVGSLLMVYLVACTGLLATAPAPLNIAVAKTSLTFGQVRDSLSDMPHAMNCFGMFVSWMAAPYQLLQR